MENMHTPDSFERSLRGALEHYEVPYNSADWAQLEQRLEQGTAQRGERRWAGLLALLFGGGLALTAAFYLILHQDGAGEDPAPHAMVVEGQHAAPTRHAEAAPAPPATVAEATTPTHQPAAGAPHAKQPERAASPMPPAPEKGKDAAMAHAPASTEVSIRPSSTEGCSGTSVEFEVTNMPVPGTRMLWNFGDGSFSTDPAPQHAYHKAGRYEVTLSMSSPTGGTIFNKPVSDVIVIHERPEAAFNPMPQEYTDRVPSVHFENKSLKGSTYFWDFGDGSTSTLQVPTHVYKKAGDYTVSLVVTNAIGCTDRTERSVRIKEDYNLLAASTFSPNGDGVEETFIPEALKTLGRRFRMTIHDPATGALMYETTDANRPWNGRLNGLGSPCPTGDYVWMVEMRDGEALGGTYTGTVSLLR